jgi:hypothetical protein
MARPSQLNPGLPPMMNDVGRRNMLWLLLLLLLLLLLVLLMLMLLLLLLLLQAL